MSITKVRTAAVLLLVMGLYVCLKHELYAQGASRHTGTYTSMNYHKDTGDITGEELRIVMVQGGEYQGTLQFSEGEPGDLVLVDIKLNGNTVSFSVPNTDVHAGAFSGIFDNGVIRGEFKFKSGATERVTLKKGKSYWD